MGRGRLRVHPTPRVVLLSVGDELVEPGTHADRTGTRSSRPTGTRSRPRSATPARPPSGSASCGDDRAILREALEDQLVRADLLVITGGLSELTARHRQGRAGAAGQRAARPGRDDARVSGTGFGTVGDDLASDKSVPIFALQGHPVAAQVSFEVFVRPALRAMAGHAELFRPSVAAEVVRGLGLAAPGCASSCRRPWSGRPTRATA